MNCANENQGIQRNGRRILSDNLKQLRKEKGCSQECVPDISTDREDIEKLAECFNKIMLPPALLHKAAELYVTDNI